MGTVWDAQIDIYRHLVHDWGSAGVGFMDIVSHNNAVQGKREVGPGGGPADRIRDQIVHVDGSSNEVHRYGT